MLVATELEKSDRNIETNDVASALVHMRHTVGVNVNDLDNRTDSTEVPRKKANCSRGDVVTRFPPNTGVIYYTRFFQNPKEYSLTF